MENLLAFGYPELSGNLVQPSYQISGNGTRDGHGGKGQEHKQMMEEIANEICDQKINAAISELYDAVYVAAYAQLVNDLYTDVSEAVFMALESGEEMLLDKKNQKVIASTIKQEVNRQARHSSRRRQR